MNVVTYVRSLEEDDELENQRYLTDIYPPAKGWNVRERFEDVGFDPKALDCPGMWEAVRMVQAHKADVLVVASLSVLTFDTPHLFAFFASMRDFCWDLVSVRDNIDTTCGAGQEALAMIHGLTNFYLEADDAKKKWRTKIKKLDYQPHEVPTTSGGVHDGQIWQINRWRNLGWSPLKIAQQLRNSGIKPPRGGTWTGPLVNEILASAVKNGILAKADEL